MFKNAFYGGIHVNYHKDSSTKKIEVAPNPVYVVLPMQQHIGALCTPTVKVGDKVDIGQKIGDSKEIISAPIHSPVNGIVEEVSKKPAPYGIDILSVVIRTEGVQTREYKAKNQYENLQPKEIIQKIREGGVVGLGGAMFPTHAKLTIPPEKEIDVLIINGAECEPYITSDHRLMLEYTTEIVQGIKILMKAVNVQKTIIGIENNKPDAIKIMKEATQNETGITVQTLQSKYPQGAEKVIIYSTTKRKVPTGKLPLDVGVVVQNVGTAKAVYDTVVCDKPLIERVITISGDVRESKNLLVKIGTPIKDLLEQCGSVENPDKVLMGGPMMGLAQKTTEAPIIKGTNNIQVIKNSQDEIEGPCIRCASCVNVCPMRLLPCQIALHSRKKMYEIAKEYYAKDCFECGACTYVCPQKIPLVQYIKEAKEKIIQKEKIDKALKQKKK